MVNGSVGVDMTNLIALNIREVIVRFFPINIFISNLLLYHLAFISSFWCTMFALTPGNTPIFAGDNFCNYYLILLQRLCPTGVS